MKQVLAGVSAGQAEESGPDDATVLRSLQITNSEIKGEISVFEDAIVGGGEDETVKSLSVTNCKYGEHGLEKGCTFSYEVSGSGTLVDPDVEE